MWAIGRVAMLVVCLLFAAHARAEDGSRSLDSVDDGKSESLGAADTGKAVDADVLDDGRSHSADSVDDGRSHSADSADTGKSGDPDASDTVTSESLDKAEVAPPAAPAPPPPVPQIDDSGMRTQAKVAHAAAVGAEQRLARAEAAYSEMMTRGYPQGDARLAIVNERDAARQAYVSASARYAQILKQAGVGGN